MLTALNGMQLIAVTFDFEASTIIQLGLDLYPSIDAEVVPLYRRQLQILIAASDHVNAARAVR